MPNITERLKSAFSSEEIIFDSSISERNFNIWTIKKQNELILSAGDFNFEMFTNFSGKFFPENKRECVIQMVIWPAFRMEQYWVNDHPYRAPQFNYEVKLT